MRGGWRMRHTLLLPGFPQHDQREAEYQEKDESLVIHSSKHSRNRVVAARMPRMTATDAAYRKPKTFDHTMTSEAFNCVFRTTRMKPATSSEQRTDHILVGPYQRHQGHDQPGFPLHVARFASSASTSARHALRCDNRALPGSRQIGLASRMTTSTGGSEIRRSRNDSRASRLTKLRNTACRASFFGITSPRRADKDSL